jgi:DNA sulfur modification protein DndB
MSNKTLIPAFQCAVGDWKYYICTMKYAEIDRQVRFAHELGANKGLAELVQRGLSNRTREITEYLVRSPHRFLGAIVVAAWGGEPQYTPVSMEDPEGMLHGLDQGFGVLTFDGTQSYFALDGQHRLRAIKDAILQNPDIGKEDLCVLLVTHYNSPEGRKRTRRLFTNINRNAKPMGAAENIALDEDDAFAVLARRVVEDHEFLREDGRVRVILSVGNDGELKLASGSVPKSDPRAITTFTVLYDLLRALSWDLPSAFMDRTRRPSDESLEDAFRHLCSKLDDLMKKCGDIRQRLESCGNAKEIRAPKNVEGTGHPFMRPVVQKAITRVAWELMKQGVITWPEFIDRLAELDWKLESAPWTAVFSAEGAKMLTGKENTVLLAQLLRAHLAPLSVQEIKRARKNFKDVRGTAYPFSEEELATRVNNEAGDRNIDEPVPSAPEETTANDEVE